MFIRNCWYVIAWDHEIVGDALFSRTVLDEPILVYRRTDGGYVALEDRCCHRLAPLSIGRREGDCVRCGYHGLKFDPSGRCIEIPGLERVPEQAGSGPIRSPSRTSGSSSGWAIRRKPTSRCCPTTSRATTRSGATSRATCTTTPTTC